MRLIFCHIPKVAGKSALGNMQKYISANKTVKIYNIGGHVKPQDFHSFDLADDWQLMVGHIHIDMLLTNRGLRNSSSPTVFFSCLRDPVDRMISLFNFVRHRIGHPDREKVQNMSLQDFISSCIENLQTKYLTPPADGYPREWEIYIAPIGRIDEAAAEVTQRVVMQGVRVKPFSERRNVTANLVRESTTKLAKRDDLSESFIAETYEKHALDKELYEKAKKEKWLTRLPGT